MHIRLPSNLLLWWLMAQVRALFPIVKDGLRAAILGSIMNSFTAFNTAVTALLLSELVRKSGGNPQVDVEKLFKASKEIIYKISGDLQDMAEEHLTRKEVDEVHEYITTLRELTK